MTASSWCETLQHKVIAKFLLYCSLLSPKTPPAKKKKKKQECFVREKRRFDILPFLLFSIDLTVRDHHSVDASFIIPTSITRVMMFLTKSDIRGTRLERYNGYASIAHLIVGASNTAVHEYFSRARLRKSCEQIHFREVKCHNLDRKVRRYTTLLHQWKRTNLSTSFGSH